MKILLTGMPKSGKTTVLKAALNGTEAKQGFVTEEILRDGQRTSFGIISSDGQTVPFASVDSDSKVRVAKYGVNIQYLEDFIRNLPAVDPANLLYIDEIGQMQLYSEAFKLLVQKYLDTPNLYLGTISCVYKNEFIDAVLNRQDVILLTINEENRASIQAALDGFVGNSKILSSLDEAMKRKVTAMAKFYAAGGNYLQLKKLFKNAIRYLAEGRIKSISSGKYIVEGDHDDHGVLLQERGYVCDCPLFRGEGQYQNNAGECSHIQAVKLLVA